MNPFQYFAIRKDTAEMLRFPVLFSTTILQPYDGAERARTVAETSDVFSAYRKFIRVVK